MLNSNPVNLINAEEGCPLINKLGARFARVQSQDGSSKIFIYQPEGEQSKDPIGSGSVLLKSCGDCLGCGEPKPMLAWHQINSILGDSGEYLGIETDVMI
jgi:hypothetical protein